jgi:hypothetical protein
MDHIDGPYLTTRGLPFHEIWHVWEPRTLADLMACRRVPLLHFTPSTFLESIVARGLLPSSYTGNGIADGLQTDPDCVYLCTRIDYKYWNRACKAHGGRGITVWVSLPPSILEPDENAISADASARLSRSEALHLSLTLWGACKHRGAISQRRMIAICYEDGSPAVPLRWCRVDGFV